MMAMSLLSVGLSSLESWISVCNVRVDLTI